MDTTDNETWEPTWRAGELLSVHFGAADAVARHGPSALLVQRGWRPAYGGRWQRYGVTYTTDAAMAAVLRYDLRRWLLDAGWRWTLAGSRVSHATDLQLVACARVEHELRRRAPEVLS